MIRANLNTSYTFFVFPQTDVFILCFAVNEINSYENVYLKWSPELKKFCPRSKVVLAGIGMRWWCFNGDKIIVDISATKIDLRDGPIETINQIDGERLAKIIHADKYIENSSKNKYQIDATIALALQVAIESRNLNKKSNKKAKQCQLL